MSVDLRLGRWEDALADVECDAVIIDAPYSKRTHAGHDNGTAQANRFADYAERQKDATGDRAHKATYLKRHGTARRKISYAAWAPKDVRACVESWAPRTRGWIVSLTDHVLAPAWEKALKDAGRYVFAPIACVEPGSRVRMTGDGPTNWSCWAIVARPRTAAFAGWGALPGAYVVPPGFCAERTGRRGGGAVVGGKTLWLMRALIRDYTRKGDLVCDPCAGAASTLIAAGIEGRRAVGVEVDPVTYAVAMERLRRGYTPTLDFGGGA